MKLLADFHTHSKFSRFGHGKDTIEQMVYHANELGLQELAITDHGYKNFFRTSKAKMRKARAIIDDINTWSKTKILLGVEANLLNTNGDIDVDEETLELLDILVVGYHRMIKTDFAGYFGTQRKSQTAIDKVTNAFIHAIEKYPVTFISHIDSVLTTDLYRIGRACKENGVMIEINNRPCKWTQAQVDELIRSDCMFVVNSDAHVREDIGEVEHAFDIIKKYNIPTQNIANVEFAEHEMTPEDIEDQIYYDIYLQKVAEQEKKFEESAARNGNDGGKLSKEMEDALAKIAAEKGINNYQRQDGYINPDDILKDEEYLNEVSQVLEEIRQDNEFLNQNNEESNVDNHYAEETENTLETEEQINENQVENQTFENTEIIENLSDDREKVEFNQVKKQNTNFISNNNIFYGIDNSNMSLNNNKTEFVPQKDAEYQNTNNQEEQVEKLKNQASQNSLDNDINSEELRNSYDSFFEDTVDSSQFNVNEKFERSQKSSTTTIQRNYNNNSNVKVNNTNRKGNFYSESGNVLMNQNKNVQMTQPKKEEPKKDNKTTTTRLSNGLIDFSSLTDDE